MLEREKLNRFFEKYVRQRGAVFVLAAALVLSVSLNIYQRSIARSVGPLLDVKGVSIARDGGRPVSLRIDYHNIGAQATRWVDINVITIVPELTTIEPLSRSVMSNPIPPDVEKSATAALLTTLPKALAICVRWLDKNYLMASSHWYFSLGSNGAGGELYIEPAPDYYSAIDRLNPCRKFE